MPKLNLKTAEERAAEIRAESDAIEAAKAAAAAEKSAEIDAEVAKKPVKVVEQVDYLAFAKAEEARAAKLKAESDALQRELDPSFAKQERRSETKPYVKLTELLGRHDNAEDTLRALHEAIREGRLDNNPQPEEPERDPHDLSHLTPQQREKTLREMEGGRKASERAAAAQQATREAGRKRDAERSAKELQLADVLKRLEEAERTIAVLRHNPSVNEVFPTTPADKVTSAAL